MTNQQTRQLLLKHSFSCLRDCPVEIEILESEKLVKITCHHFDSSLIEDLATCILPREHDVVVFRDDDIGWTPPLAPYRLQLTFGGQTFDVEVVLLSSALFKLHRKAAVTLRPTKAP